MPAAPQSLKTHARVDPPFHYFVVPVLALNLFAAIAATIHHWPQEHLLSLWWIVVSLALLVNAFLTRIYALKAQDRIIRLEERLRLSSLLPATDRDRIHQLTERQLVALRFASDPELPSLARRAIDEHLTSRQIKEAITSWRPDHFRI